MRSTFRFDDVCANADTSELRGMSRLVHDRGCRVIWCVSPLVHDMSGEQDPKARQRVYPQILNAHSDPRAFYRVQKAGLPRMPDYVVPAGHGLVHVDHRLLERAAQEMSVLVSCSLVGAGVFVPPFNKWDADTEAICAEHGIELVKFEDGWLCAEYNRFDADHPRWYLHHREFTEAGFAAWLDSPA